MSRMSTLTTRRRCQQRRQQQQATVTGVVVRNHRLIDPVLAMLRARLEAER